MFTKEFKDVLHIFSLVKKKKIVDCIEVSSLFADEVEKEETRLLYLEYDEVLHFVNVNNIVNDFHPLHITNTVMGLKNKFPKEFAKNKYLYNLLDNHFKKSKCEALISLLKDCNSESAIDNMTKTIVAGRLLWEMRNQLPDLTEYLRENDNYQLNDTSSFNVDFMHDYMHGLFLLRLCVADAVSDVMKTFKLVRDDWQNIEMSSLPFTHHDCQKLDKVFVELVYLADMDFFDHEQKVYYENPTLLDYKKLEYVVNQKSVAHLLGNTFVQKYFSLVERNAILNKRILDETHS
jgi:hypothetical protein